MSPPHAPDADWVRAGINSTRPLWGHRRGIQVGVWPASIEDDGEGGPRGLLRVGYPLRDGGTLQGLINFIAVEPIVDGKRGFSELEKSAHDDRPGLRLWSGTQDHPFEALDRGALRSGPDGQALTVMLYVERFANGAQPVVELEFRADRPDEVRLTTRAAPGSAQMDTCILTATMGNYARLRRLWLRGGVVTPRDLWPDFAGDEFTPDAFFPPDRLPRTHDGDTLVCATTDEPDPASVPADPRAPHWRYRGSFPVTQFWRKPKEQVTPALRVRVNGRRVYWANHTPIPGGLAFENFELVEPFREGQSVVFGVTRRTPGEMGVVE